MCRQVEICCGSYYDAIQAYKGGATRIELNSALHLGGLTPSVGMLRLTKKHTTLKVMVMIRCRSAGFCYSEEDYQTMLLDAEGMLEEGADGIVFGFLDKNCGIDLAKTTAFTKLAKKYGKEAVFHRAFDNAKNAYKAMQDLIRIGVDRVLTSGQQPTAWEGRGLLSDLQQKYGDQIEILAGSGLNAENVQTFIQITNVQQVHSSCKGWMEDPTTHVRTTDFGYARGVHQLCYEVVDEHLVKTFVEKVKVG